MSIDEARLRKKTKGTAANREDSKQQKDWFIEEEQKVRGFPMMGRGEEKQQVMNFGVLSSHKQVSSPPSPIVIRNAPFISPRRKQQIQP